MAPKSFKQLIAQGLSALQAGSQVAAGATAEMQQAAHDSRLKSALDQGTDTSTQWASRIDRALAEVGGAGKQHNPILETHYQVSQQSRQQASDDLTGDLGIIAAGQLALHYWIASFGTLRTYAIQVGLTQTQQELQASLDKAKTDQTHLA